MLEPMFARWDEVEACVYNAAEGVLTEYDPTEGPPNDWQIEWAQEQSRKIVQQTMFHLDGWTPADIAAERAP